MISPPLVVRQNKPAKFHVLVGYNSVDCDWWDAVSLIYINFDGWTEGLQGPAWCGSLLDSPSQAGALAVSVWEVYSDLVILDWYITLQQKFRLVQAVSGKEL